MNAAELWWEQVPAGAGLLDQIARALQYGCSIVMNAQRTPWPAAMREYVRTIVTNIDNALHFEVIDASECEANEAPDAFIFACIGEDDYLGTQLLRLNHLRKKAACLWVEGIPPEQYAAWVDMAAQLSQEQSAMTLILDLPDHVPVPESEGLIPMGVGHARFDVYYFSLMQVSGLQIDERLIEYAATLCTEASLMDPECCSRMCGVAQQLMQDPERVASSLMMGRNMKPQVLRAQMRTFMPLVELCRMMANEVLADALSGQLPFRGDYDTTVEEVSAFELRHIIHLRDTGRIRMEPELYSILRRLREVRNGLAHVRLLAYDQILDFLSDVDQLTVWHNSVAQAQ